MSTNKNMKPLRCRLSTFVLLQILVLSAQIEPNASETTPRNPVIKFPGAHNRRTSISNNNNNQQSPACSGDVHFKGQTFCTDVENYPDIAQLDEKERAKLDAEFSQFFGNDSSEPSDISERNDFGVVEYLCSTREQVYYPKKGLTKENEWLFIVNDDKYKQGIRTEYCDNENGKCNYFDHLPQQFEPVCKQFYIFRSLAAIVDKVVQKRDFQWPSCCKCALKRKSYS